MKAIGARTGQNLQVYWLLVFTCGVLAAIFTYGVLAALAAHGIRLFLTLALVLVLGVTVMAMAAGPGPNAFDGAQAGMAGQGAAIHGDFVNIDGDEVCENYATREPAEDGTGNRWGGGQGQQAATGMMSANFVNEDGDGVCDTCLEDEGTGQPDLNSTNGIEPT